MLASPPVASSVFSTDLAPLTKRLKQRAQAPSVKLAISSHAVSPQPASLTREQLPKVSLAHVRDPKTHHIGLRPALIDTQGTAFGAQIQAFQKRTSPEALAASPLRDDSVTSTHGRKANGAAFKLDIGTLASRVEPYLQNQAAYGEGGAYTFTPIMVNKDRNVPAEFAKFFPPAESWHQYFIGSEPDTFPVDLLGVTDDANGLVTGPKINTSLILGVGVGEGQEFHWHGGNVFVQVHGEKKWSLFSNPDLYAYFAPGEQYERRKPCPFDAKYADVLKDLWWKGPADMPRPTELITRPGDALYLPTGMWHATWNLTDYTVGYTKVIEA